MILVQETGTKVKGTGQQNAPQRKDIDMEKEMLAIAKFKSGEGKFEKFMGWMQSDEGMGVRKTIAPVSYTHLTLPTTPYV